MRRPFVLLLFPVMIATATEAYTETPGQLVRQRIAEAYGITGFSRVLSIHFTFNVTIGEKQLQRTWVWQPSIDGVTFKRADGTQLRYARDGLSEASPDSIRQIDAWFVNDQYWLLFPLHLGWDTNAVVNELPGMHPLPIGEGTAKEVVVSYPTVGGYTPGDVYDLFVSENHMLVQWIYHRGGSPDPTRIATWEDHQRFGPLWISLTHRGPDESFRVWFTDVNVELVD